jgi:RNA polymerase sigma factor (sigma-70 family)
MCTTPRSGSKVRLSRQQEALLCKQWQAGNRQVGEQLLASQIGWACQVVLRYLPKASQEEVLSLAYNGLLGAFDNFNPQRGRLTTCAYWYVRKEVSQQLWADRLIRVPRSSRGPRVQQILHATISPIYEQELASSDQQAAIEDAEEFNKLAVVLKPLSDRSKYILRRRHFEGATLNTIAGELGCSRQRVYQLTLQAYSYLRKSLRRPMSTDQPIDANAVLQSLQTLTVADLDRAKHRAEETLEKARAEYRQQIKQLEQLRRLIAPRTSRAGRTAKPCDENELRLITSLLEEHGPQTAQELATALTRTDQIIRSARALGMKMRRSGRFQRQNQHWHLLSVPNSRAGG